MKKSTEVTKQISEEKKDIEILPTGFNGVDNYLEGGFLKKELVVLGGRTGGGKSLFAGSLFFNIARKGYSSAYFSLEISNQMVVSRLIGAKANISPTRIMIKTLEDKEQSSYEEARADVTTYDEFMFFYDDIYEIDLIEKEIKERKYDFVVIDFIQNVMSKQTEEYDRLSYIALRLQKLAKNNNLCILAVSQLSNMVARDNKNNQIVEYKGSGAIGHAADLGLFIEHRDNDLPGYFDVRLRKNRRGISGQAFHFQMITPGGRVIESML